MNYTFLINPRAGSGKGLQVWHAVKAVLDKNGISYRALFSKRAGHPRELAIHLARKQLTNTCLVVIGGDGTLHEALTGLIASEQEQPLPAAYIPAGTGNDFARGYGISFNPLTALQQILDNHQPRPINVGHYLDCQQHKTGIFLNNFGIGFDAAIVEHTVDSKLKAVLNRLRLGTISYALKTIKILFTQPPFHVRVTCADRTYDYPRAFLVVTSNHPYIGGGVKIAADQRISEEKLELAVLEKRHWPRFLFAIIMFATGRLINCRQTHLFRGKELTYQTFSPQYGQTDGEVLTKETFNLKLTCRTYPFWQVPKNYKK